MGKEDPRNSRPAAAAALAAIVLVAGYFALSSDALHPLEQRKEQHHESQAGSAGFLSLSHNDTGVSGGSKPCVMKSTTYGNFSVDISRILEVSTEEDLKEKIAQKMLPRMLAKDSESGEGASSLAPRQFLHLHHMKTGGTSMDHKLQCAISRLGKLEGIHVPYYSLHECSRSHYERCKAKQDPNCLQRMQTSAVISYCAPLKDLPAFGWDAYKPEGVRRLQEDEPDEDVRMPLPLEEGEDKPTPESQPELPDETATGIGATEPSDTERKPIPDEATAIDKTEPSDMERKPIPDEATEMDEAEPSDMERMPIPEQQALVEPLKSPSVSPYDSITVLRNPVGRVWSMFRFQTRNCYACRNLTDIYASIDSGFGNERIDRGCLSQLLNHETTNLLSSSASGDPGRQDLTDDEADKMVAEATHNMHNFFTVIGLTERLPETVKMVDAVFPWMAESVEGTSKTCPLPHANASPSNNRCGPDYTHWDLPSHPDEATAKAIMEHNKLDMKLYDAATQLFELQWEVFQEGIDSQ